MCIHSSTMYLVMRWNIKSQDLIIKCLKIFITTCTTLIVGDQENDKRKEKYKEIFDLNKRYWGPFWQIYQCKLSKYISCFYFVFIALNFNPNSTVIYLLCFFFFYLPFPNMLLITARIFQNIHMRDNVIGLEHCHKIIVPCC